jgi:BlaI family penicillinase repressor
MPRLADLPKSELEVARVVWRLKAARVRDVVADLSADGKKADFWTVQTYLRRLKTKGYLTATRDGRAMVYAPAVKPARVVRDVVADFVARLFNGRALPLVQHLIDDATLSDADIDELQKALDDLKRRRRP